jgi:hypothetical protein
MTYHNAIYFQILYKIRKFMNIIEAYLHYRNGMYYKYPKCCIKQFCEEVKSNISPGMRRELKYYKNWAKISKHFDVKRGFIPCDKCIEDLLEYRVLGWKNIKLDFELKEK